MIERLWKFTRRECLASEYYENFGAFKTALMDFFDGLDRHAEALSSLLTLNFQTFEKAQSLAA